LRDVFAFDSGVSPEPPAPGYVSLAFVTVVPIAGAIEREADMNTVTPEVVEQCSDELPEHEWIELSMEELGEVGGGQSTVSLLD
jgi:hypothetical protein